MRPLRYSINITIDGCCDHTAGIPTEALHHRAAAQIARADAMILGRVTYGMMESAWRAQPNGELPDWMEPWMVPFARTMDAAKKYVVSSTLPKADWNSEFLRGDLATAVQKLKDEPGKGLALGGVTLPLALANLGLIDEYEFIVHPRIAGRGPSVFAGLSKAVDLRLIGREEFGEGFVALQYEPKR